MFQKKVKLIFTTKQIFISISMIYKINEKKIIRSINLVKKFCGIKLKKNWHFPYMKKLFLFFHYSTKEKISYSNNNIKNNDKKNETSWPSNCAQNYTQLNFQHAILRLNAYKNETHFFPPGGKIIITFVHYITTFLKVLYPNVLKVKTHPAVPRTYRVPGYRARIFSLHQ